MLTVYICAAALLAVVTTGGRLGRLAQIRFRHAWLLWAALAVQIIIISVIPDSRPALLSGAHVASYLAAGAFLLINRHLPGAWLIGAGGALNGIVIALNGGTLPASATALQQSGRHVTADQFNNSAVLSNPHLPMLGDVFATPSWLPTHNIFSLGDIAIWLGVICFLWRTCRPRPTTHHTARNARSFHKLHAALSRSGQTARQGPALQYVPETWLTSTAAINRSSRQHTLGDKSRRRAGRRRRRR